MKHGYAQRGKTHWLYSLWNSMLQRCENPNDPDYPRYGGREISVCERWHDFECFLEDVAPRPPGKDKSGRSLYSLDRIDNVGDYEPGNVKWSTAREQARNASFNRRLTCGGETLLLCEWAERLGVTGPAIMWRLKRGMSESKALSQPFRRDKRRKS